MNQAKEAESIFVAAAVTGLFALRLSDYGVPGAEALVPLSFSVVIATIFAHGFTAQPFARWLGLDRGKGNGVLLVGANSWTIAFADFIKSQGREVLIADASKLALRRARRAGCTRGGRGRHASSATWW